MRTIKGFTLIELLIVVVIIGILATIAIPKFATSKEKAFLASMKSDLRNLATQQESYNADWNAYTTGFPANLWQTSTGVTGPSITLTADGWTGIVGHTTSTKTCAIYFGSTSVAPATQEGVAKCSP